MLKESKVEEKPTSPTAKEKRPRGRPPKEGVAATGAQRIAKLRAERKASGLCPCCGQALPSSNPD